MAISVICECGKTLRVPDQMQGKRGKCGNCGRVVSVPLPTDGATQTTQSDSGVQTKLAATRPATPSAAHKSTPAVSLTDTSLSTDSRTRPNPVVGGLGCLTFMIGLGIMITHLTVGVPGNLKMAGILFLVSGALTSILQGSKWGSHRSVARSNAKCYFSQRKRGKSHQEALDKTIQLRYPYSKAFQERMRLLFHECSRGGNDLDQLRDLVIAVLRFEHQRQPAERFDNDEMRQMVEQIIREVAPANGIQA